MKLIMNPVKFLQEFRKLATDLVPTGQVPYANYVRAWSIIEQEALTVHLLTKKSGAVAIILNCAIEICKIGLQ